MHDQVVVGILHGKTNLLEQLQTFGNRKFSRVAEFCDRLALDAFHHDELTAILCHSPIEQPRDVRMVETGQDSALLAESTFDLIVHQTRPDQFDGDLFAINIVGALRQIDHTHPASSDLAYNPILADHSPNGLPIFIIDDS